MLMNDVITKAIALKPNAQQGHKGRKASFWARPQTGGSILKGSPPGLDAEPRESQCNREASHAQQRTQTIRLHRTLSPISQ